MLFERNNSTYFIFSVQLALIIVPDTTLVLIIIIKTMRIVDKIIYFTHNYTMILN